MAEDERNDEVAAAEGPAPDDPQAEGQLSEDDIAAVVGGLGSPDPTLLGEAVAGEAL